MYVRKFERFQLVDIQVPANFAGTSLPIPDQPMLRDKRITGIQVHWSFSAPRSFITGNPTAQMSDLMNGALTLYTGDPQNEKDTGEYVYRLPLMTMQHFAQGPNVIYTNPILEFDELKVQWEKCEIVFGQAPAPVATFSYLLAVYYTSRMGRAAKILHKALGGIGDGTFADMLVAKMMQLEDSIKRLTNGK